MTYSPTLRSFVRSVLFKTPLPVGISTGIEHVSLGYEGIVSDHKSTALHSNLHWLWIKVLPALRYIVQLQHFSINAEISRLCNVTGPMARHNCHGLYISTHPLPVNSSF